MNFLSLHQPSFGLDISDLSLKIINLEKRGRTLKLASFGETKIEEGIIKKGEIKDVKALSEIIKRARAKVQGKKIKTKNVICSLPEEKAFLEVIHLPKMAKEEVKKAVSFEAENYIPLPIEDVYLDSQIIPVKNNFPISEKRKRTILAKGEGKDNLEVLIAALPKKTVDPYVQALKGAGLIPQALEIESLAIARATIKEALSRRPILIIDLGATRTSFIIFAKGAVRFTSSIPISSQLFTENISKSLKINREKAEKLKRYYGLKGLRKVELRAQRKDGIVFKKEISQEGKIFEALIPILTDLSEQIRDYLDYYLSHALDDHSFIEGEEKIATILLSGGGSNLKGLPEFLSGQLKIPVKRTNPWINILPPPLKGWPEMPPEESLRYTTAIGLALRGLKPAL